MNEATNYQEKDLVRFEDLFENALIGLHIVGGDGIIKRANKADYTPIGLENDPASYIGKHIAQFHSEQAVIEDMLDRLIHDRPLVSYKANLKSVEGDAVPVAIYSNSLMDGSDFVNTRCFTKPVAESIQDFSEKQKANPVNVNDLLAGLNEDEKKRRFTELEDFFMQGSIPVHIVGPDGTILWANQAELKSMGYEDAPEEYIGQPIMKFHADQAVIEEMLTRLLDNRPLVNFSAKLVRKDGTTFPVSICSNSRMENGEFINTRCFTYPLDTTTETSTTNGFVWPRNEDIQA
ncbi:PAS domain-containing protein [Aureisphaera galaxeae]|uniref:PAS domain-containing protein n=1 Tax=Aureisphaera galaxeae TaxID=1538023 RepID=UPI00234FC346|nr:PAS domain-containing protein [Aureisphaera galaxeae]MDC8004290.1 PAS domain-containing protein [Aureisphaera galaxeae]